MIMKRRDFILIATTGIAAVAVPYYYLKDVDYDSALAKPQLLSTIWDTKTINTIGNQYRLQVPDENSERILVKLLSADLSSAPEQLDKSLQEKIKKDFETGNTVMIDGWILSITEARQCALFSTTNSK
jgi:hypothetical protein